MRKWHAITLTVNKNKKEGDNLPNFNMSVKFERQDGGVEFLNIGAGWKKLDRTGQPYISLSLASAFDKENNPLTYTNKNGDVLQRKGYVILDEVEYRNLLKKVTEATGQGFVENLPF